MNILEKIVEQKKKEVAENGRACIRLSYLSKAFSLRHPLFL